MNRDFWRNRRVLVTGHTGFKGGWLSLWLTQLGAQVTGYALPPPTQPSFFASCHLDSDMTDIRGDVMDLEKLQDVISTAGAEIVFHLAAQSMVRPGYIDPLGTYAVNVLGTAHVLEAVRRNTGVKAIVGITSDKCYANQGDWPYTESDHLGGDDPYSSSKGCAELVIAAYRKSYLAEAGIHTASARAGNVIGGGDWAKDRLIPDLVRAFSAGKPVRIRYPNAIRPWQHVLDLLSGYMLLAQRLVESGNEIAGAWNFGPLDAESKPVGWITENAVKIWGRDASWELDTDANPKETHCLRLDSSHTRNHLGWQPRWRIDKALAETLAWYQAYEAGQDMRDYSLRQIARHTASNAT